MQEIGFNLVNFWFAKSMLHLAPFSSLQIAILPLYFFSFQIFATIFLCTIIKFVKKHVAHCMSSFSPKNFEKLLYLKNKQGTWKRLLNILRCSIGEGLAAAKQAKNIVQINKLLYNGNGMSTTYLSHDRIVRLLID